MSIIFVYICLSIYILRITLSLALWPTKIFTLSLSDVDNEEYSEFFFLFHFALSDDTTDLGCGARSVFLALGPGC